MKLQRAVHLMRPSRTRRLLRETKALRKKEKRWKGPRRPDLWELGFLSESAMIYDFTSYQPSDYLSDFARFVKTPLINPSGLRTLLMNKLAFNDRLYALGYGDYTPDLLGIVCRGEFHASHGVPTNLRRAIRSAGAVVAKPIGSGGGSGVRVIEGGPKGPILVNGRPADLQRVLQRLTTRRPYLLERRLVQHSYSKSIYPRTTNTLRILTMRDVDADEPFIAIAVHRIGSESSYPVDNWTRGGISCRVDESTGQLSRGATFHRPSPVEWQDSHPDTQTRIAGTTVPLWTETKELVLGLAKDLSYLPYVGWDVTITEEGPRVIEGNSFSDVNLLQVHSPLLIDRRIKRFYRHYGVL